MATSGAALEFGIGTGRIAVPLSHRNVRVHGIELSPAMLARLLAHPDSAGIDVTLGDFATDRRRANGTFELVYLCATRSRTSPPRKSRSSVRQCGGAPEPGGCFVIENYVPELPRLPAGETTHVFTATPDHLGFEEYDVATQTAISYHHWTIDGHLRPSPRRTATSGPPNSISWRDWPD